MQADLVLSTGRRHSNRRDGAPGSLTAGRRRCELARSGRRRWTLHFALPRDAIRCLSPGLQNRLLMKRPRRVSDRRTWAGPVLTIGSSSSGPSWSCCAAGAAPSPKRRVLGTPAPRSAELEAVGVVLPLILTTVDDHEPTA